MRILMVKTSSLGDIIHAFPVVSFLHQEFVGVKIDWVVEKNFADIVKAHPGINKVIEMDTKGWRKKLLNLKTWGDILNFRRLLQEQEYDAVIDLQGNAKSAVPTFLSRSKNKIGFGSKSIHEWPNLFVTNHRFDPPLYLNVRDENLYLVQYYFRRYSAISNEKIALNLTAEHQELFDLAWTKIKDIPGQKILFCPGSAWKNKQLSYEALQEFLLKVHGHLKAVILLAWGTTAEKEMAEKIRETIPEKTIVLDKFPLPVLQRLMNKMDLIVAMDSLPLHLAGTSGTPTFSVFGASSAQKYKPLGDLHQAMQGPCVYGKVFERRCPMLRSCATGLCIHGLSGEDVFKEFCEWHKTIRGFVEA